MHFCRCLGDGKISNLSSPKHTVHNIMHRSTECLFLPLSHCCLPNIIDYTKMVFWLRCRTECNMIHIWHNIWFILCIYVIYTQYAIFWWIYTAPADVCVGRDITSAWSNICAVIPLLESWDGRLIIRSLSFCTATKNKQDPF